MTISREELPCSAKMDKVPLTAEYTLDLEAMEKNIDGNTGLVLYL